jgi:D-alanine-D-alanine ligase
VLAALRRRGVDAEAVDPAAPALEPLLGGANFDRDLAGAAWAAAARTVLVQGALETLGLPYTGSGVLGSAIVHGQAAHQAAVRWPTGLATPPLACVLRGPDDCRRDRRGRLACR